MLHRNPSKRDRARRSLGAMCWLGLTQALALAGLGLSVPAVWAASVEPSSASASPATDVSTSAASVLASAPAPASTSVPAAPVPASAPVLVVSLRIYPAGSAQEAAVRQALAATLAQGDPPKTLAEIDAWSQRLTTALRQGGFPIGQVLMTQDDWGALSRGGPAVFAVFPGRISNIVLDNHSRVNDDRLRRTIARALCPGGNSDAPDPLKNCLFQTSRFERTTQLLQDLPGVALDGAPQFGPGAGAGDVTVAFKTAERGKPLAFDAFVDNNGIPATGRTRLGISASANNYLGLGEDYALSFSRSSKGMWAGSFMGSLPLGWDGLRANAQYTRSQYTLAAGGTSFVGTSNTYGLGLSYPFTRGLDRNVWGGLSLLHTDATLDYGDLGYGTRSHLNALRASVSANNGDRPQQLRTDLWSVSGALTVGRQQNNDPLDVAPQRAGDYAKLSASGFGRLMLDEPGTRFMTGAFSIQSSLNRNLDSSEQFTLGGPTAVRAYRSDEALVDDGLVLRFDARQSFTLAAGHVLQVGPIVDLAYGRVNHRPWAGWSQSYVGIPNVSNVRRLAGYGVGVEYLTPIGLTFSFSAAKPFAFSDASWVLPGKKPAQYWLSLSWNY